MSGDSFATAALGEAAAKTEFSRWGWAFREQPVPDFGIDAHAEPFKDGEPSGKLIALQIKAGPSYFKEQVAEGWVYRPDNDKADRHLRYWLRHSLPVILLMHRPDSGVTYWARITQDTVEYTDASWKVLVPFRQVLGLQARPVFEELAEAAPAASDDPLERSCSLLPPSAADVLLGIRPACQAGALRLAALLAAGRSAARLTAESVLSAAPSWLPTGAGKFEAAVAAYASEHGHPDVAADAYARAASYSQPPDGRLLAYAALCAAEADQPDRARALAEESLAGDSPSLLAVIAGAVTGHLGKPGPVPVPDAVAQATAAERADEPVCTVFLAMQALQRQDASTAVRYLEQGLGDLPRSTAMMLKLASALQARVVSGRSPVQSDDLQHMRDLGQAALDQRRHWSGPSAEALAVLIRGHMHSRAFSAAARLAGTVPEGAEQDEACADEIVILGTQAALTTGDLSLAQEIGDRAASDHARAVVQALTANPDLPAAEQAFAWRAALADDPPAESQMLAVHQLACLGIWPLPELETLHNAGVIDDEYRDILAARAMAGQGELTAAVATLRSYATRTPAAADFLVDVLTDAGRYEEALEEASRGSDRFGDFTLAYRRLNLLVLAGRPREAADEAHRLLGRPGVAVELRLRIRRDLIVHHASAGDWARVEQHARAALSEAPGSADFQWHVIAATVEQGRLQRAYDLLEQFSPEITTVPQARQWLSLHAHFGFSHDDIDTSLDLLDQWNDEPDFVGAVLSCLATAEGLLLPDGTPVLPDMQPVTLARFRDRFSAYIARNHDGPIRPYTGDLQQLAEMSAMYQTAQRQAAEKVARDLRSGRTTVGALAACLTKPYACELLQPTLGFLPAVSPDPGPFSAELDAAKAALDHPVIIETSAIVLATLLPGRWPRLRGAFTDIRMTRDAWNDLIDARSQLLRDPETIFSVSLGPSGKAGLQPQSAGAAHERLVRHFREIERALNDLSLVTAPGLGELARYTFGKTDPALSPLAECAVNGSTLWSDDAALRKLAAQHKVQAFGTLALLHVLTETSRADDTLRQDVVTLARNRIGDLVLTTEELTSLAAENNYQPGPATLVVSRPLFWATPGPARAVLTELAAVVNQHAPATLTTWLQAACTGLATRLPSPAAAVPMATSLAETVADRIHANDEVRASLTEAAAKAAGDAILQ